MSKWYVGNEFSGGSIYHFGILGMKWGVRRYQNSDGTLTPAGKKRYDRLNNKANKIKDPSKRWDMKAKARKYGTETRQERDEKTRIYERGNAIAKRYGFKGDNDMDGDFVNSKKDIVIDKDVSYIDNFDGFMKKVDNFNNSYNEHNAIMKKAAVNKIAERLGVPKSQVKAHIDSHGRPFIYISDSSDGGLYLTADYDIGDGMHVASVEYNPEKKVVYYVTMNG